MISEANQKAIEAAGLSFILGTRIPYVPYVVREWRDKHPDEEIPDGHRVHPALAGRPVVRRPAGSRIGSSTTSTATTGPGARCAGSTSRSPRPNVPSTGMAPVKRNRFIQLDRRDEERSTATSEAKTRALAGLEGLHHQPAPARTDPRRVRDRRATTSCGASRRAFRMSKHDLQARPVYHRTRDSIDAHLTIVFAALAVSALDRAPNRLDHQEIRPHRSPLPHRQIQAGNQTLTAADPPPADLAEVLAKIHDLRAH